MLSTGRRAGRRLGGAYLESLGGVEWGKNFDIGRKCWLADNEMQGRAVHSFSPKEPAIPPLPMTELARGFADALDLMEPRGDFSTLPLVSRSPLLQVREGRSTVKTNAERMRNHHGRVLLPGTIAIVFIAMHFCTADISLIIL